MSKVLKHGKISIVKAQAVAVCDVRQGGYNGGWRLDVVLGARDCTLLVPHNEKEKLDSIRTELLQEMEAKGNTVRVGDFMICASTISWWENRDGAGVNHPSDFMLVLNTGATLVFNFHHLKTQTATEASAALTLMLDTLD